GKARIFSHPVYLSLKEFSLQDSRGDSVRQYGAQRPSLDVAFTCKVRYCPEWVESLLTSLKLCGVFVYKQPEKLLLLQPFTTMQP
ncbi:hypothetical protein, partial [Escherichia coli]|uniref:hypothetical protein n=1 Tax=Escherichia coli TaxID=562 RepID=UPI001A902D32